MVISHAPRLAPSIIRRPRLEDWFFRYQNVPVRFVVAPAGSGKTAAILGYLRSTELPGVYCNLPNGCSAADVRVAIACAMNWDVESVSRTDIIQALVECAPLELALDGTDIVAPDAIAEILWLIEHLPEGVSLIVACRARSAIDVGHLIARGSATLCDAERLAFNVAEISHLCEACDVPYTHADVTKMLDASDGWAIVVSGAIRKAAEDRCGLSEAFERWRNRHGHLFTEFVTAALDTAGEEDRALVCALMSGTQCADQQRLHALEMKGLFVVYGEHGYRPLRAISRLRSYRAQGHENGCVMPMQVRLFGRFQAQIDGKQIEWIRRRDAQIFKYIALKRGGSVTRAELSQTFWPGAESHLVAQSVRTACSNIRKAIGNVVGFDAVDAYFRAHGNVSIQLDSVVIDVNRFLAHANDGDQQFLRNDLRAAYVHYRTACKLYTGNLLVGDVAEPWFLAQAAVLEDRHLMILERLLEIGRELGDHGAVVAFAERIIEVQPEKSAARTALAMASQQLRLKKLSTIDLSDGKPGEIAAVGARA